MEKTLFLFILLCNVLLEVRCLQCYVCDNCPKVKEEELQTCGIPTTPGPSTIFTFSTQLTTPSTASAPTTTPATFISTTTKQTIPTKNTPEPATISTTVTTELSNTSTTTTEAYIIPTIATAKTTTNSTTFVSSPPISSTTIIIESTTSPIATTAEPIDTFTTTTGPVTASTTTSDISTITTEPGTIPTKPITEPAITSEPKPISTTTKTEPSTDFIATASEATITPIETVTEPVISYNTSPTEPRAIINITTEPTPIFVATYPESTKPFENTNATNNLSQRRPRSLHEDCSCKNEKICDCLISQQRSKRYALRGLALSKEDVKYVCVVDKFQANDTEFVKRGCAVMEDHDTTSCVRAGFGTDCKICDTDQCNGASVIQTSAVFLFICCIQTLLYYF